MVSFFVTIEIKSIYHESLKTRAQARLSIFDYVEFFYNRIRLQERLNYDSPEDAEEFRFSA